MKGRLIVLEGIDGSGKTTQTKLLGQWLPNSGLIPDGSRLIVTSEPGGTLLGQSLRRLLLQEPGELKPTYKAELLLMMADRAQHIDTVIQPALDRGDWVLCDRFFGSTLAYQGFGRGISKELLYDLQNFVAGRLKPDLVFWLYLPVEEALMRLAFEQQDRIDKEGKEFLRRVQEGYRSQWLRCLWPYCWYNIQARHSIESVQDKLQSRMRRYIETLKLFHGHQL